MGTILCYWRTQHNRERDAQIFRPVIIRFYVVLRLCFLAGLGLAAYFVRIGVDVCEALRVALIAFGATGSLVICCSSFQSSLIALNFFLPLSFFAFVLCYFHRCSVNLLHRPQRRRCVGIAKMLKWVSRSLGVFVFVCISRGHKSDLDLSESRSAAAAAVVMVVVW